MKNVKYIIVAVYAAALLYSCSPADGDFGGSEYMPDMAHSIAYEANTYTNYYMNTWDSASVLTLKELSNPHLPVKGTVPRGYAGLYYAQQAGNLEDMKSALNGEANVNAISVPLNGAVPFYYGNSEAERARAIEEIIENPFPITAKGLEQGKALYDIYCGICHGAKGDGQGYLVSEQNANAVYPAAPANLLLEEHVLASNGRYYYTIMQGRNLMGAYKDKLSYEERWQVIHYIRSLQAKELKMVYDENANTLNPAHGTPGIQFGGLAEANSSQPEGGETAGEATSDNDAEGHEGGGH